MASFTPAYQLVAIAEGGYQAHPEDSGNYNSRNQLVGTNWGISAPVYESYLKRPPTVDDMKTMTRNTAMAIYKESFWTPIKGNEIRAQRVANVFLDGYVNHGGWGIEMMQEVLGVKPDRKVGPITIRAINAEQPDDLVNRYVQRRREGYQWLANNRPGQAKFLNGWLKRLQQFVSNHPASSAAGGTGVLLIAAVAGWWLTTNRE